MNKLIVKSILGLAFLLVFLGCILFITAGSLSYWQAWIYLAVFGGSTLLVTLYLMKYDQKLLASRVSSGPVAETQKRQQVIQSLASVFFIALFVMPGLDFRYHWSNIPPVVSLIGDGFVILGFYIVFLVFQKNSYTSATIEVANEQTVISTGPYGVVRHPMYAGASILLVFTPIALGSWLAIPFALAVILVVAVRALEEEKFLATNLPGYEEYRQKVHYRLIPFIW